MGGDTGINGWIRNIEGTVSAPIVAAHLAILAAMLHAVFAALQKGRHDPWLSRGAIDFSHMMMALPFTLFALPRPEAKLWPIFAGILIIHLIYKILQAKSLSLGNYTAVYPVMRGTAPIFAISAAYLVFDERFSVIQWLGVLILLSGIFGLAAYNMRFLKTNRDRLPVALIFATATGAFLAIYTAYDAWGIRQAPNPVVFVVWFYVVDGLVLPPVMFYKGVRMPDGRILGLSWCGVLLAGLLEF